MVKNTYLLTEMHSIYQIMHNIFILYNGRMFLVLFVCMFVFIYLFTREILIKSCKSNLICYISFPKFTVYQLQISLNQLSDNTTTHLDSKVHISSLSLIFGVKEKGWFLSNFKWNSFYPQPGNWSQSHFH